MLLVFVQSYHSKNELILQAPIDSKLYSKEECIE